MHHNLFLGTNYALPQKKLTFDLSIFPDAPGSLTLTYGLDDYQECYKMMYDPTLSENFSDTTRLASGS